VAQRDTAHHGAPPDAPIPAPPERAADLPLGPDHGVPQLEPAAGHEIHELSVASRPEASSPSPPAILDQVVPLLAARPVPLASTALGSGARGAAPPAGPGVVQRLAGHEAQVGALASRTRWRPPTAAAPGASPLQPTLAAPGANPSPPTAATSGPNPVPLTTATVGPSPSPPELVSRAAPEPLQRTAAYLPVSVQASRRETIHPTAAAALASGAAVADGSGGVVFLGALGPGGGAPGTPGGDAPGAESGGAPGAPAAPGAIVQRAADASPPESLGTAAAAPAAPGAPQHNLDDLAAKLYDRIRARLKSELRLDRERAGLITDLRG
jgi:hypothetical protein